jgi:uncharacterized tellurite resistance protein B-like protein
MMRFEEARMKVEVTDKDRMKVAFAIKISGMVVQADGVVRPSEEAILEEMFPPELLSSLGLDDTETFVEIGTRAFAELKDLLTHDEKLQLIEFFFAVCDADADVHPRELEVVVMGAERLGLGFDEVHMTLQRMLESDVISTGMFNAEYMGGE